MFRPSELNVATEPFREQRAQYAATLGVLLLLSLCLCILLGLILHSRAQAADYRATITQQRTQLARLQSSQSGYNTILNRPANADVFSQSVFLNQLIARRAVSWTQTFEEISHLLPYDVQLLSVQLPQVASGVQNGQNQVELDMWVGTEKPQEIILLLRTLQKSKLFGAASVMTETPPTQNDPLYKFRLTVAYAQQL